jgi:hypothetical protein
MEQDIALIDVDFLRHTLRASNLNGVLLQEFVSTVYKSLEFSGRINLSLPATSVDPQDTLQLPELAGQFGIKLTKSFEFRWNKPLVK